MGAFKTRAGRLTASLTPNAEGSRGGIGVTWRARNFMTGAMQGFRAPRRRVADHAIGWTGSSKSGG